MNVIFTPSSVRGLHIQPVNGPSPTGATLPTGTTLEWVRPCHFYLGLDSQFFQDNGRKFYLRVNRPSLT